jgi:hypothetical protein
MVDTEQWMVDYWENEMGAAFMAELERYATMGGAYPKWDAPPFCDKHDLTRVAPQTTRAVLVDDMLVQEEEKEDDEETEFDFTGAETAAAMKSNEATSKYVAGAFSPNHRILEIGTGTGADTRFLAKRSQHQVYTMDHANPFGGATEGIVFVGKYDGQLEPGRKELKGYFGKYFHGLYMDPPWRLRDPARPKEYVFRTKEKYYSVNEILSSCVQRKFARMVVKVERKNANPFPDFPNFTREVRDIRGASAQIVVYSYVKPVESGRKGKKDKAKSEPGKKADKPKEKNKPTLSKGLTRPKAGSKA